MPSKNLCCCWQLIMLAAVVLRTDLVIANFETKQQKTIRVIENDIKMNKQSTVDSINSKTIESDAMNVISLQPPPLTRTLLLPATIMGTTITTTTATSPTTITTKPIALNSSPTLTAKAKSTATATTDFPTIKVFPSTEITHTSLAHSKAIVTRTTKTKSTETATTSSSHDDADDIVDDFLKDIFTTRGPAMAEIPTTTASSTENIETLYDYEYGVTVTTIPNDATALLHPPSSDSLTKGFTIPTFLPPVREFAVADLPSYLTTSTTTTTATTTMSDELLQQHDQLYLATHNRHPSKRKNLTLQSNNVSVQLGNHAFMPCNIRRLQNKPVSWVRVRDGHILAVDQTTFIADQRFQSIFNEEDEHTWSLQIKYVQKSDEGWYECQVSTEPKMSSRILLEVVVPTTELIGDQSRFVKAGSKVALHCIIRGTIVPPTYIIWYREKIQIMNDNKMGWFTQIDRNIFGNTSENHNTIGSLIIPSVRKKDSGNYTCQPSNSESVSVDLHVLSGEYSASAIMSAARTYELNIFYILLIFFLVMLQKT